MKIAVIGVTGLVGNMILKVLEENKDIEFDLLAVASEKSIGKNIVFNKQNHTVLSIEKAIELRPDIAIFSAGSKVSLQYAPLFAEQGSYVIDNSSAWRMYDHIPLIVPEINASQLKISDKIISNPNCSTIQLVMVLHPLHSLFTIKRIVISTYQAVSGSGTQALNQMECERKNITCEKVYPHPIDKNVIPHGGDFEGNRYTTEETKLLNETRKILSDSTINLTATVVRVPVESGHAESVNIEFENHFQLTEIHQVLASTPGLVVADKPTENLYPMPLCVAGKNEVFVGRIRRDFSRENCLNMWIVADNLRKGAATNAVQIAHYLIGEKWVK